MPKRTCGTYGVNLFDEVVNVNLQGDENRRIYDIGVSLTKEVKLNT